MLNKQAIAQISTTRLILQFVYQDMLNPPDEFDQIIFSVRNTYDQYLFNLSSMSAEFQAYMDLETAAYEYSIEKVQWTIRAVITFFQPIKLTKTLFETIVRYLDEQRQFRVVTNINSAGK